MPTAVVELIAQNIVTALQGVTITAGYTNTLTVERRKPHGNDPIRNGLAVLFQGDPDESQGEPTQRKEWVQPFHVLLCAIEPENSEVSIDARLNSLRADVEKALMASPNRGGYAVDTTIRAPHIATNAHGDAQGVVVNFDVKYRTSYTDPYTQG